MPAPARRIIAALDVPDADRACALAVQVRDHVAMVKVGLESFVGHGPALVRRIRHLGLEVFLDLKLHDIPRTAAAAAAQVGQLDVRLLTVHASGGADMVRAVRDSLPSTTQLLAVTVLTSLADADTAAVGLRSGVAETALRLGELAMHAGADGLVCSAHELRTLSRLGGIRVVPGVRPTGADPGDQQRTATPRQAIDGGATYLVVGRPIVQAVDPASAAARLQAELIT